MPRFLTDLKFHKCIFYEVNVVFWVLGWGSIAVGVWLYLYTQDYFYIILAPTSYSALSAAGLCAMIGVTAVIIAFIGFVGNWLLSRCLMISFIAFVSLLFVVHCITGLLGFFYIDLMHQRTKLNLLFTINHTYGDNPSGTLFWNAWNHLQTNLKCCGADNYTNWFYSPQWRNRRFVPDSCCNISLFNTVEGSSLNCGKSETNNKLFYEQGCGEPFADWLLQHLYLVGVLSLIFMFVETFLLATSLRILCHICRKHQKQEGNFPNSRYNRNGKELEDGECTLIMKENDN